MAIRSNGMRGLIIALGTLAAVGRSAGAADTATTASPQALKFAPVPDLPACATAAILRGDPRSGPAWVLLKLESGCRVPWHWHTANEALVVISGRGTLSMKDGAPLQFAPGAYASLPSHHVHQASCSRSCLLFNEADAAFDIHYVSSKGEEIPAAKALEPRAKAKTKR